MEKKKKAYHTQLSFRNQIVEVAKKTGFRQEDVRKILEAYSVIIAREVAENGYVRVLELAVIKKKILKAVKGFRVRSIEDKELKIIDVPERPTIRCAPLQRLRQALGIRNEYDKYGPHSKDS